jgi:hypothetical protein
VRSARGPSIRTIFVSRTGGRSQASRLRRAASVCEMPLLGRRRRWPGSHLIASRPSASRDKRRLQFNAPALRRLGFEDPRHITATIQQVGNQLLILFPERHVVTAAERAEVNLP